MKHFITLTTFLGIMTLSSCATSVKKTNELKYGMQQNKVEELFGKPLSTRGTEKETYLTYLLKDGMFGNKEEYVFVFDESSELKTYGKQGDFDSLEVDTGRVIQKEEDKK